MVLRWWAVEGQMSETDAFESSYEQFAGARVFRNFQDLYIKPHTECCYT